MTPPEPSKLPAFGDTYLQSIAEVLQGSDRIGLGFFLDELIVVTCSHVVRDAGEDLRIRVWGVERLVHLAYNDPDKDVAFLKLDVPASGFTLYPLELESKASPGAVIQFVGWPRAPSAVQHKSPLLQSNRIQAVAVAEVGPHGKQSELYELGEDCQPGFSGGPVVLEGRTRACGMIHGRDPQLQKAFAIPGSVIANCYQSLVAETRKPLAPGRSMVVPKQCKCGPPGGRYNSAEHIARPQVDRRVMELFEGRNPVVLCAPLMTGKTWWLNHFLPLLKSKLGEGGCIATPLPATFGRDQDLKSLLLVVIDSLVRSVRGDAKRARDAWDDELVPAQACSNCLEDHFFDRLPGEALLVLNLLDEFWDNPHQGEFFALLRCWSTRQEPWNRLRLLVAYSTTPSVWSGSVADSPFSVMPVVIDDWTADEIRQAAAMHGVEQLSPTLVGQLSEEFGGHPYLVRHVIKEAQASGRELGRFVDALLRDPSPISPKVEQLFASCQLREDRELQQALHAICKSQSASGRSLDRRQYRKLYNAGLIRGTQSNPSLRARLFARLLFPND